MYTYMIITEMLAQFVCRGSFIPSYVHSTLWCAACVHMRELQRTTSQFMMGPDKSAITTTMFTATTFVCSLKNTCDGVHVCENRAYVRKCFGCCLQCILKTTMSLKLLYGMRKSELYYSMSWGSLSQSHY